MSSEKPSNINEDFYERRRIIELNTFNNRNLIEIFKEARLTMAMNDIEPIPDWHNQWYGEREPFQEVKAHLISPYSCRISAASRSVDDNTIADRGRTPVVDSRCVDRVSHRVRDNYNYKFLENFKEYTSHQTNYGEQHYKYFIHGEPLPIFLEQSMLMSLRELRGAFQFQLGQYRSKGFDLDSIQKEFVLLRLLTSAISDYSKRILDFNESPFNKINVVEVGTKIDRENRKFLAIYCYGDYKYNADLEKVIGRDKSYSYYMVPLTTNELAAIYQSVLPYMLDLIYD